MNRIGRVTLVLLMVALLTTPAMALDVVNWAGAGFTPSATLESAQIIYEELYAYYQEQNPDVNFSYEILPGGTEALQRVLAAASTGDLPALGVMDGFWIPRLVERGIVQPLNDLWPEEDRADFMLEVIDAVTFDGNIYALWFHNAWRGLFYREDLLEQIGYSEVPTDLDEFIEMSLKFKDLGYWAVMLPGANSEVTFLHMLGFFWGFGGRLVDDEGRPVFHEGENREALRQTYQIYYDLVNVHQVMPRDIITMDETDVRQYLYSDEAAMVAQTSSALMGLKAERPDLYEVISAANYPMPEGYRGVPHLVGWTYAIFSEDPEVQQAAWDFIAVMTEPHALGRLNEAHGHLPVRASIFEDYAYFRDDRIFSQFYDIVFGGEIRPRPAVPIYPNISNALTLMLAEVIEGLDIEEAIDEAADEVMMEWNRMQR